jgi:hypothetical protein
MGGANSHRKDMRIVNSAELNLRGGLDGLGFLAGGSSWSVTVDVVEESGAGRLPRFFWGNKVLA